MATSKNERMIGIIRTGCETLLVDHGMSEPLAEYLRITRRVWPATADTWKNYGQAMHDLLHDGTDWSEAVRGDLQTIIDMAWNVEL